MPQRAFDDIAITVKEEDIIQSTSSPGKRGNRGFGPARRHRSAEVELHDATSDRKCEDRAQDSTLVPHPLKPRHRPIRQPTWGSALADGPISANDGYPRVVARLLQLADHFVA